jgi:hypothetical protein
MWTCRVVMMPMLEVHQAVGQVALAVVVNQGDGADHLRFRLLLDTRLQEKVADQVTDGLGAVGVPLALDQRVEALKKILFDGDSESNDISHLRSTLSARPQPALSVVKNSAEPRRGASRRPGSEPGKI